MATLRPWIIPLLIAIAIIAYIPALTLPFISDDWSQIPRAREFAAQNWAPLWKDKTLAARPTYVFLSAALDYIFGFTPRPYYAVSIALHVLCTLLVFVVARLYDLPPFGAFVAAFFFAIYEGHQEAVMWVAASSDLLVFLFGLTAWICWRQWLTQRATYWYILAILAFLLALASKESAWILPALMLLIPTANRRRALLGIAPFALLAALYILLSWMWRVQQPGYNDIRFTLSALFPLVVFHSLWRLVFIWGLIAAAVLAWLKPRQFVPLIWISTLWMVLSIVPYSFITYMNRIPSRHTYLASAGLAFLVGAAATRLYDEKRHALLIALGIAAIALNLEILWVKKMQQFRERGEPSERLHQIASQAAGPVTLFCTPLDAYAMGWVLRESGSSGIFPDSYHTGEHCFTLEYHDRSGRLVKVDEKLP